MASRDATLFQPEIGRPKMRRTEVRPISQPAGDFGFADAGAM